MRYVIDVPWAEAPYNLEGALVLLHSHNGGLQAWLELGSVGALILAVALNGFAGTQIAATGDLTSGAMAVFLAATTVIWFLPKLLAGLADPGLGRAEGNAGAP